MALKCFAGHQNDGNTGGGSQVAQTAEIVAFDKHDVEQDYVER